MDDSVYLYATTSDLSTYLGFPPENTSYHLAIGSGITPASGAGRFLHQTQPFPGAAWINPCLPPHPTDYADAPQSNAEVYSAGCNTPMWSTLIRSTDEEAVMQRPGNLAPCGVVAVIRPSDSLCRERFLRLNLSAPVPHSPLMPTLLGPGGLGPIITSETNGKSIYAEYTHVGTPISWHEDELSANVPSDQGHQCHSPVAGFHSFRSQQAIGPKFTDALPGAILYGQASPTPVVPITPDFLNPSTLQGACTSSMAQHKVQGESRDFPQQFPQASIGPAVASSPRSDLGRSPDALRTTKVPYLCKDCGKVYAQPQGLSRHRHEMHGPRLCTFCGVFRWGRRYLLKGHIKREHPELNTDEALDEATGARHGATVTSRRSI